MVFKINWVEFWTDKHKSSKFRFIMVHAHMQALKENRMQPECGNQSGWDPPTQICIFFQGWH